MDIPTGTGTHLVAVTQLPALNHGTTWPEIKVLLGFLMKTATRGYPMVYPIHGTRNATTISKRGFATVTDLPDWVFTGLCAPASTDSLPLQRG